jgi:hypothetical protein
MSDVLPNFNGNPLLLKHVESRACVGAVTLEGIEVATKAM